MIDLETINQWASPVTAFATVVYMAFTGWLIWETREGRKAQERPQIDIYIQRAKDWGSKIELFIKNNGYSGAHNIQLSTDVDFTCLPGGGPKTKHNKIQNWGPFTNGIPFLPPRGERNYTLTILSDNFEEKMKTELPIHVTYKDGRGAKYKAFFRISFNEFENTLLPIEDPLFKIADYIKAMKDDLHSIRTGWSKLQVIHQSKHEHLEERRKQDEESKKRIAELNAQKAK